MRERITTAIYAAIPFLALILFAPTWLVSILWIVLVLLAARELAVIQRLAPLTVLFVTAIASITALLPFFKQIMVIATVIWWCMVLYLLARYEQEKDLQLNERLLNAATILSFAGFVAAASLLHQHLGARVLWLFVVIWVSDSAAYFVGRKFGKYPLAPTSSPKKTIEGLAAGVGSALIMAILLPYCSGFGFEATTFFLTSAFAIIFGVVGDLWESVFKRRAGIKDSGTLLPGHGGVWDRVDSWLAAFPFWALAFLGGQ